MNEYEHRGFTSKYVGDHTDPFVGPLFDVYVGDTLILKNLPVSEVPDYYRLVGEEVADEMIKMRYVEGCGIPCPSYADMYETKKKDNKQ